MDVLSAVLAELRLESAAYRHLTLRPPWRLLFDGGLRGVHVVVRGRCRLLLDGRPPLALAAGDLVVLPQADSHELVSEGGDHCPAVPTLELARRTQGSRIVVGPEPGEETVVVCGAFFLRGDDHPAVAGFPRCIHVPGQHGRAPGWLAGLTEALAGEALDGGPGSAVVMARLSDALVTRALRHHLETADEPGWLRGLQDPCVARSLAALHADPAAPWTLPALAREAGLSRAAFAARFARTVGQPPMQYLFGCRMRRAMTLLSGGQATAASVASRVGYGSSAAFTAAFVRHTGTTPGRYRQRATSPDWHAPPQPGLAAASYPG